MDLSILKEKIKKAQLEYGHLQDMYYRFSVLSTEQQNCAKCTQGCPIIGTQKCQTGCALFAAIG